MLNYTALLIKEDGFNDTLTKIKNEKNIVNNSVDKLGTNGEPLENDLVSKC